MRSKNNGMAPFPPPPTCLEIASMGLEFISLFTMRAKPVLSMLVRDHIIFYSTQAIESSGQY